MNYQCLARKSKELIKERLFREKCSPKSLFSFTVEKFSANFQRNCFYQRNSQYKLDVEQVNRIHLPFLWPSVAQKRLGFKESIVECSGSIEIIDVLRKRPSKSGLRLEQLAEKTWKSTGLP